MPANEATKTKQMAAVIINKLEELNWMPSQQNFAVFHNSWKSVLYLFAPDPLFLEGQWKKEPHSTLHLSWYEGNCIRLLLRIYLKYTLHLVYLTFNLSSNPQLSKHSILHHSRTIINILVYSFLRHFFLLCNSSETTSSLGHCSSHFNPSFLPRTKLKPC